MYILESTDSIKILDSQTTEFNGHSYYKALVQFPKGLDWIRTSKLYDVGDYEGFSVVINNGKDMLVL